MKQNIKNSIRIQLISISIIIFVCLMASNGYILFLTSEIQTNFSQKFEQEHYLKNLQDDLQDFQQETLNYLSSKSSQSLGIILSNEQKLKDVIACKPVITSNQYDLREKELYSLIELYFDLTDKAIQARRGRNISTYTSTFEEMDQLINYINREIDEISLERFRIQLTDYDQFINDTKNMQVWNMVFLISISLLMVVIIIYTCSKMIVPINELSESAKKMSACNFDVPDIPLTNAYEIDECVMLFNRMKNDISVYIKEITWQKKVEQEYMKEKMNNMKMQQLMKRMELYTMQAQMNPHFLFNTLNTGVQLAIVENADNTAEYMENLAKLFRHNLSVKDVIVPLSHEIEGLKAYFYILQIRFSKKLTLSLDVPESLLNNAFVPVSILQPLVENSIVHAFRKKTEDQQISVKIYKENEFLRLSVTDNGCGMTKDLIEKLLQPIAVETSSSKVMGLENVIQRLYFFYPQNKDIITIESKENQGTKIQISINMEENPCTQF